jgi:NADH-quinone oxidoreductase subunit C
VIETPALMPETVIATDGVASDAVYFATPENYFAAVTALKADGFEMCLDVCGVDYLEHPTRQLPEGVVGTRFEVVVQFLSVAKRQRVRVRVQAGTHEPRVDSLFALYPSAEAAEREVFDMFGVLFDGHPDLTRILMPEDWEGHPLRKDFSVGRVPVQFKEGPGPR